MQNNPIPQDITTFFKDLEKRVRALETKETGTIISTDPETGVQTIFGDLSTVGEDRYGFKQFHGDAVPPVQPSVPTVTSTIDLFTVSWDGLDIYGDGPPVDYHKTVVEVSLDMLAGEWSEVGELYGKNETTVSGLLVETDYYFRLVSYDTSGNASTPSDLTVSAMRPLIQHPGIADKIAELEAEDVRLDQAAKDANTAAAKAQEAADKAAASAGNRFLNPGFETDFTDWSGTGGTIATDYFHSGAKSLYADGAVDRYQELTAEAGQTWRIRGRYRNNAVGAVDGRFELQHWNGTLWVNNSSVDLVNTPVDTWETLEVEALIPAGATKVRGRIFFNAGTLPTWVDDMELADITESAKAQQAADAALAEAEEAARIAGEAQTAANGKNTNWYTDTEPAGTDHQIGDLWFDEADGNAVHTWDGNQWLSIQDQAIAAADEKAAAAIESSNGKNTTYYQDSEPAGSTEKPLVVGDLWFDTNDGYKQYRYAGPTTLWQSVQDQAIAAAVETAGQAQTAANGKNTVHYGTTEPSGTDHIVGDTWFDEANGNRVNRWDGSDWVVTPYGENAIEELAITNAKISNLDGAKITADSISGTSIKGKTITAENLAITDTTVFAPTLAEPTAWSLSGGMSIIASTTSAEGFRLDWTPNGGTGWALGPMMPVIPGEHLYAEATLYRTTTFEGGAYLRYYWYDKDKNAVTSPATGYTGAPESASSPNSTKFVIEDAVVPENTAFAQYRVALNTSQVGAAGFYNLVGRRKSGATLIEPGAISTGHVSTDGLDAGIIKFGEMEGARIKANSISVDKILIGSTDNMVPNPLFLNGGEGWNASGTGYSIDPTGGKYGDPAFKIVNSAAQQGKYSSNIEVEVGGSYFASVWVKSDVAIPSGGLGLYVSCYGPNGSSSSNVLDTSNAIAANTWTQISGFRKDIADNFSYARLGLYTQSGFSTGTVWFYKPSLTRMGDGNLIVDGTITADSAIVASLDGGKITADSIDGVSVKAGTLTSKHVIVSGDNKIVDPYFEEESIKDARSLRSDIAGGSWGRNSTTNRNWFGATSQPIDRTKNFYFVEWSDLYDRRTYIPVQEGDKWRFRGILTSSGGGARFTVRVIRKDGTTTYSGIAGYTTYAVGGSGYEITAELEIPADYAYILPAIQFENSCTSAYVYGGCSVVKMADGKLIVDGAIDGKTITGATIRTTNNRIRMNDSEGFVVSNGTSNTFTINPSNGSVVMTGTLTSGSTITGSGVRASTVLQGDTVDAVFGPAANVLAGTSTPITGLSFNRRSSPATSPGGIYSPDGQTLTVTSASSDAWRSLLSLTATEASLWGYGGVRITATKSAMQIDARAGLNIMATGGGWVSGYDVNINTGILVNGVRANYVYSSGNLETAAKIVYNGALSGYTENFIQSDYRIMFSKVNSTTRQTIEVEGVLNQSDRVYIRGVSSESQDWAVVLGDVDTTSANSHIGLKQTSSNTLAGLNAPPNYDITSTAGANVYLNSSGWFYRSTSTIRNKLMVEDLANKDDAILSLRARTWIDRGEAEDYARYEDELAAGLTPKTLMGEEPLRRIPGMVAEEVEEAGLTEFVIYDKDGEVQGLMYERLAVALIPVVARMRDRYDAKIEELESRLNDLQG